MVINLEWEREKGKAKEKDEWWPSTWTAAIFPRGALLGPFTDLDFWNLLFITAYRSWWTRRIDLKSCATNHLIINVTSIKRLGYHRWSICLFSVQSVEVESIRMNYRASFHWFLTLVSETESKRSRTHIYGSCVLCISCSSLWLWYDSKNWIEVLWIIVRATLHLVFCMANVCARDSCHHLLYLHFSVSVFVFHLCLCCRGRRGCSRGPGFVFSLAVCASISLTVLESLRAHSPFTYIQMWAMFTLIFNV